MNIFKKLLFGTTGAVVAWLITDQTNGDLLKLSGYLILFNAISFAASFKKKNGIADTKKRQAE